MKSDLPEKLYKMTDSWKDIPWGEHYRIALNNQLQPWWSKIFGFYLLKVGQLSLQIDTKSSFITHQLTMNVAGSDFQLLGDPHEMPFKSKSINACLLIQQISCSAKPHWLFREIDRILVDDGWLILSNFNPISLIGVWRCIPILCSRKPYDYRIFSTWRQLYWLSLLNYKVLYQRSMQIIPWISPDHFINRNLKFAGCINLIIARKRTLPLIPMPIKCIHTRMKIDYTVGIVKC